MESETVGLHAAAGYDYTVETLTEEEYREWVERTFRPMFEPFERIGGIPCNELLSRFQYHGYGLPRDRRNDLILYMDANRDGIITFEEFRSALVRLRYKDLNPWKRFALRALLAGNPGLRLQAARERAVKHLQALDAQGRHGAAVDVEADQERLPSAITGSAGGRGHFKLEPDGVWPTTKTPRGAGVSRTADDSVPPTIMDEEYIPQSYLDAYNCVPPPIFIPLIVLVQLAVFIYYAVELNRRAEAEPENVMSWATGFPYFSPLYFDPRRRREVWRYLTYMFIHQGIWHIVFNSFVTLVLGCLVEWVHKLWRVAPVYLAGVLAGSLACSVWDPFAVLAGSSGGAYALVGAHLALVVINWEELKHDFYASTSPLAIISSGVTRVCLIVVFCGVDFGIALYERFGLSNANLHVSVSAHIAGFLAGLLVGIPILRNLREKPWERVLFWVSLSISLALLIFAIFWNIFWPGYPEQQI
ncbi:unnamed protein product [Mesocestoides corti]|uniref:EF-hand domain-containing protein n=2 Tax=Mesocestoides corti TaxID=53468 RepID=A0A0R3UGT0_MESCO|nr:unnamed protein product [Mesocestoides corti]